MDWFALAEEYNFDDIREYCHSPNLTLVGFEVKMGLHKYAVEPPPQTQNKGPDSIGMAKFKQARFTA